MGQIEVSDAPARAAASAAVAIGVLRTIAGAAGGGGLAGAVAGTAGDLAVIGSSKAAQVAMNREFDNKANDVERQFSAAQDRWSYLVDLYHKKCI